MQESRVAQEMFLNNHMALHRAGSSCYCHILLVADMTSDRVIGTLILRCFRARALCLLEFWWVLCASVHVEFFGFDS